jgi:hypothetical protein
MGRNSNPSSYRERLWGHVQWLLDLTWVVPVISQNGQNRQFSAVISPGSTA